MAYKLQSKFNELGIYSGQELFLNIIAKNDRITAIELANLTNRKRFTITRSLQSLEKMVILKESLLMTKENYLFI